MAPVARGFALHSGALPSGAGIVLLLESPGPDEPVFLVKDLVDGAAELGRRRERYPELEEKWLTLGAPVVGRAGTLMWWWMMSPMGLHRIDVAIFNTLHCYPGKDAKGNFAYPKGPARKRAEATCADLWLRPLISWDPTVSVVAMHPSALSRDVTPLPVVLRAIERAKQFAAKGERVLLLMGGKAAKNWMGYGENTTRWCCHWQRETDWTRARRAERWAKNKELRVTKERKVKKLTAKTALALLLQRGRQANVGIEGSPELGYLFGFTLTEFEYEEMLALCAPKVKKAKEVVGVS